MSRRQGARDELSPELTVSRVGGWRLESKVGEGAGGLVFRASRDDGALAAIKIARTRESNARREVSLIARAQRRWGPALLGAGRLDASIAAPGGSQLEEGALWSATTWIEGAALVVRGVKRSPDDRRRLAASVAHAVGRGLAELHLTGVRHGDVKPTNILVDSRIVARVDRAKERGITLVDLDLAAEIVDATLIGGTPRYLAPELRAGEPPTPAADQYALGLVLAEILCPSLAEAPSLDASVLTAALAEVSADGREIAGWITSLVALSPGARPSAEWIASRAARFLNLGVDADECIEDRRARVRRAYIAVRWSQISVGGIPSEAIDGPARLWLDDARSLAALDGNDSDRRITPLDSLGTARWLVALVGPAAAAWPVPSVSEGALASRLLELAAAAPPEAWTISDLDGSSRPVSLGYRSKGPALWVELARGLGAARPDVACLEAAEVEVGRGGAPAGLAFELAAALLRRGEVGRSFFAVAHAGDSEPDSILLRAEIARRVGDVDLALRTARRLATEDEGTGNREWRDGARALIARLAWDAQDLALAEKELGDASGASASEVRALIAYSRGELERGVAILGDAARGVDGLALARIEGTRGLLEHARGEASASHSAFARAVELAVRAGALLEEATYLTGLAAAAVDAGMVGDALRSATRAALLWERLGRRSLAARAHLSRAAAFALVGAAHEADLAAGEARAQALASNDLRAAAFARWAIVETRPVGDRLAREEALAAASELSVGSDEDQLRAAARVLLWARDISQPVGSFDDRSLSMSAAARWEWWGARAASTPPSRRALSEILSLLGTPAPIGSRGPTLAAAVRLARSLGDGEVVRRLEALRRTIRSTLWDATPAEYRASIASVPWLEGISEDSVQSSFGTAQVGELESIVRALSSRDRLKPLLEQVVDTMVLWTGVERGLLLLRAPDDRLVPRAARNIARQDLAGEQLSLSKGLAMRAISERQAILATDAFAQVGDLHASVHALGLRSVLAVPLIARGDVLGVVYLDDRVRRGAFGPSELAWVRLVASQAALAIADARDQALLRRAVRRAERANARLSADLGRRESELAIARAELAAGSSETRFQYDEIAGRSEPMRAMLKLVDRITPTTLPVLVAGESGTGKELVAKAIHRNGPRGARPFVSENCGSVPESLLESTLFGHIRGAFTGAVATRAGLFDVADGGTLFLDEIGEMSLSMQTKLLRVLQDGEVRPVGGERSRKVDVRIIGATHRDLEAMVAQGSFREDLFYRLNVFKVKVPALRERAEDVPLLVGLFVEKHGGGRKMKVTRAAMDRLMAFPWPGNVRQLENEVRRALALAEDRIDIAELSADVAHGGKAATKDAGLGLKARVDALETELVREALKKTKNNQTRAAETLGISRFGLQKMMRRLGIRSAD